MSYMSRAFGKNVLWKEELVVVVLDSLAMGEITEDDSLPCSSCLASGKCVKYITLLRECGSM